MDFEEIIKDIKGVYKTRRELNKIIIETKMDYRFLLDDQKRLIVELNKKRKNYNTLARVTEDFYDFTHPIEHLLSSYYVLR